MRPKYMKNKIKLIILLIPLIILSTGCQATYNLNITDTGVEETLNIEEEVEKSYQNAYIHEKGTLDGFYNSSVYLKKYASETEQEYINKYYINKDNFDRDNILRLNNIYNNGYQYLLSNTKDYSQKNNSLINNLIKDSLIINDDNIIVHLDNIPNKFIENLDVLSILIKTDLTVTSNNADSVSDNTYTWNYDKTNNLNKSISLYIERPKKEEDTKNNDNKNYNGSKKDSTVFSLIIVIGIYLAIIIAVINIFNKKKKLF